MAVRFNGVDQGYGTFGMINIPDGPFTAMAFFRTPVVQDEDTTGHRIFQGDADGASTSLLVGFEPGGLYTFVRPPGEGESRSVFIETYPLNEWMLVACRRDSSNVYNISYTTVGADAAITSESGTDLAGTILFDDSYSIAYRVATNSSYVEGDIEGHGICDRRLSDAELIDIASGSQAMSEVTGLIFHLPLTSADATITDTQESITLDRHGSPTTVDGPFEDLSGELDFTGNNAVIFADDSEPAEGATVYAVRPGEVEAAATGTTDASGEVTLTGLTAGTYATWAERDDGTGNVQTTQVIKREVT